MVHVRQTQRSIFFDQSLYQKKAELILTTLGYHDFDLGIWLTTNATIQKYNRDYRNQDKPTDILSFPYHTNLKAGEQIKVRSDEDKNIGDIIISVPYVLKNTKGLPGDFIARMDRMLVHGVCHLLGHDHINDDEYKVMLALENKLLKKIATIIP